MNERSLLSHHEVALKVFNSRSTTPRGVSQVSNSSGIKGAVTELVEDLYAYEDWEPTPAKTAEPEANARWAVAIQRSLPRSRQWREMVLPPDKRPPARAHPRAVHRRRLLDGSLLQDAGQPLAKHGLGGARLLARCRRLPICPPWT